MSSKTIPFSARISVEDVEFISALEYEGASTPSDKLRALLSEMRRRYGKQVDYSHNLAQMQEWFTPMKRQLLVRQDQLQINTEIVNRLLDSLPELLARLQTLAARAEKASAKELRQGEQQLMKNVLGINELLLPLAARTIEEENSPEIEALGKLLKMIGQFQTTTQGEHA